MVGDSQSAVKFVNHHPTKIDVVKFDDTNNFGMWRCKVMNALTASNLKDSLRLEEKSEEASQKDWDKMNRTALLAQRPSTLVLMMTHSCSYVY